MIQRYVINMVYYIPQHSSINWHDWDEPTHFPQVVIYLGTFCSTRSATAATGNANQGIEGILFMAIARDRTFTFLATAATGSAENGQRESRSGHSLSRESPVAPTI